MPSRPSRTLLSICLLIAFLPAAAATAERRTLSAPPAVLFIGQDSDTLAAYAKAVPEHTPKGITLNTSLRSADPQKTLEGVFAAAATEAGTTDFQTTLAAFPKAILALGLSLSDGPGDSGSHLEKIAAGEYDGSLGKLVEYLAGLKPRSVFLQIGYEFDGPWNGYQPEPYKAAFRAIRKALREGGADNVVTVWQSAAWPDPSTAGDRAPDYDHRSPQHLERWYPGDEAVDWIGLSAFHFDASRWSYQPPDDPAKIHARLLDFARRHDKPVMIAAAAPQGYSTGALTVSTIQANDPQPVAADTIWNRWYRPFFAFVHANQDVIRAVAYVDADWQSQPRWRCEAGAEAGGKGCPNGYWGDSRVAADAVIKEKWLAEILDSSYWFNGR